MLLQLFEMQDKNSAWTSLCLDQQAGNCDSKRSLRNLQRSSSLRCNIAAPAATDAPAYLHKYHDFEIACNDSSSIDNCSDCSFHRAQQQTACNAKIKLNQLPNICRSDKSESMPSTSQTTESKSVICSNSTDCEKDVSKLSIVSKISHDTKPSKLRLDLIIPNGE